MKKIESVTVSDVEKRRVPSKHYVYVIFVRWSDGGQYVIYRRYSRFFDLQGMLLDKFPIEAGTVDPTERILPILPGKILFGRSHVREVALKRLKPIEAYCKALIALPPQVSQCQEVLEFFEVEDEDLDPPRDKVKREKETKADKISQPKELKQYVAVQDYRKQDRGEIDLHTGSLVELVEQSHSGWWFVNSEDQQGWVPSTYLQAVNGGATDIIHRATPGSEEHYMCIETYLAAAEDELSLQKGDIVEVVERNMEGWWLVRSKGVEGLAPATYLTKAKDKNATSLVEKGRASGVEIITSLSDISDLLKNETAPLKEKHEQDGSFPYDIDMDSGHSLEKGGGGLNLYSKVNKTQSLERGGSIRPPPRQKSFEKAEVKIGPTKTACCYCTTADFTDTVGDGISFKAGETVKVHERAAGGWWYVEIGEREGWAPASHIHLQQKESIHTQIKKEGIHQSYNQGTNSCQVISSVSKPLPPPKKKISDKPALPLKTVTTEMFRNKKDVPKLSNTLESKSTSSIIMPSARPNVAPDRPVFPPREREGQQFSPQKEDSGVHVTILPPFPSPKDLRLGSKAQMQTTTEKPAPLATHSSKILNTTAKSSFPPQLPFKPKPKETSEEQKNQGITASLKAKFEQSEPVRNLSKSQAQHSQPLSGTTYSLASKFSNLKKTTSPKPQLPLKPSVTINGNTTQHKKDLKKLEKGQNECRPTSGNVNALVSALGSKLRFDEEQGTSQRHSWIQANVSERAKNNTKESRHPTPVLPKQVQASQGEYAAVAKIVYGRDSEVPLDEEELVEVSNKSNDECLQVRKRNCKEGYVPSSFLETRSVEPIQPVGSALVYTTVCMFTAENEGEIGFDEGEDVEVVDKLDDGWWLVRFVDGREGWAPSDFIKPAVNNMT